MSMFIDTNRHGSYIALHLSSIFPQISQTCKDFKDLQELWKAAETQRHTVTSENRLFFYYVENASVRPLDAHYRVQCLCLIRN